MAMAESNGSHSLYQTLQSLHAALDPKSLLLTQFSDSHQTQFLHLTTDSFFTMERGPRYKEYADLRNKRLRMRSNTTTEEQQQIPDGEKLQNPILMMTPPRKQVKFNPSFLTPPKRPKGSSILAQSVPDFSSVLQKENRKPVNALPPLAERSVTPPSGVLKGRKVYGSKSTNSAEKRSGGLMGAARKSYASVEELKGLAAVGNGVRSTRGIGKTVLGYSRQF